MKFISSRLAVLAGASALMLASLAPAHAATVSYTVEFTAYFEDVIYNELHYVLPPFEEISGSFNFTIDPNVSDTYPATLNWMSPDLTGPWIDLAWIWYENHLSISSSNAEYYWIFDFGLDPPSSGVFYAHARGGGSSWESYRSYHTVTAIPLPLPLLLFVSGLGLLGLLGWRKKQMVQTAT